MHGFHGICNFRGSLTWHYCVLLLETFLTGLVSLPVCVLGLLKGTLFTVFEYSNNIIGGILERIYDQLGQISKIDEI